MIVPEPPPQGDARIARAVWHAALACFVLAAVTGAGMRFAMMHGLPWGLSFENARHAHSHLMFFAWVTPALMMLALRTLHPAARGYWVAAAAVVAGLLAYLPFLTSGYHPTTLFGRELPLSMMAAGLNGAAWYAYAAVYLRARRHASDGTVRHALDAALFLLLFASLGALGLAALGAGGLASPDWMQALVAAFLDPFADGWFALALLALAYAARPDAARSRLARPAIDLLSVALAVRTVARLARDTGTELAVPVAAAAGVAAGMGLLLACMPLLQDEVRRRGSAWSVPLALLALKGGIAVVLALPAGQAWSDAMALRVLWLHAYLLGGLTLGLLAAARDRFGATIAGAPGWTTAATLVLLAGLLPLTGVWPRGATGTWVLPVAAWTSLAPPAVVLVSLLSTFGPSIFRRPMGASGP
ncbi:MAG: hypothetical protein U5K81_02970 [Trueperaceae bacterium]|nr:hypothetical protein [Trueperaceae bacterium]